jgi:predicted MPP superfamily phosphohydrolase
MNKMVQTMDQHRSDFPPVNHVGLRHCILYYSDLHLHFKFLENLVLVILLRIKQALGTRVNLGIVLFLGFAIMPNTVQCLGRNNNPLNELSAFFVLLGQRTAFDETRLRGLSRVLN